MPRGPQIGGTFFLINFRNTCYFLKIEIIYCTVLINTNCDYPHTDSIPNIFAISFLYTESPTVFSRGYARGKPGYHGFSTPYKKGGGPQSSIQGTASRYFYPQICCAKTNPKSNVIMEGSLMTFVAY